MKKLLIERGKEINKEKRGSLNLLLIRQAYLVKKLHAGSLDKIKEHKIVQDKINVCYHEENKKVQIQ